MCNLTNLIQKFRLREHVVVQGHAGRAPVRTGEINEYQLWAADANADGMYNVLDVVVFVQLIVGS